MSQPNSPLITVAELQQQLEQTVVADCRFSLADADEGESQYRQGHIPGAVYLHLNRDMSGPLGEHGGRHPLPDPAHFCERVADALAEGYVLYGSPAITHDGTSCIVAQAVVLPEIKSN